MFREVATRATLARVVRESDADFPAQRARLVSGCVRGFRRSARRRLRRDELHEGDANGVRNRLAADDVAHAVAHVFSVEEVVTLRPERLRHFSPAIARTQL